MKLLPVLVVVLLPCVALAQSSPSFVNLTPPKAGALTAADLTALAASKQDVNGVADFQKVTLGGIQQTLATALESITTQLQTVAGQVQNISLGALSSTTDISTLHVTPAGGTAQILGALLGNMLASITGKPDTGTVTQTAASNAALVAMPTKAGYVVRRLGFATAGDGGSATYGWQAAACTINSGAGDNGLQVAPTSGSGCWMADFSGMQPTPMVWGATGTGLPGTDDTAAIQAALNARAGFDLFLGDKSYRVLSALNMPVGTRIIGDGAVGRTPTHYNLIQGAANINVVNMNLTTRLEHLSIDASQVTDTAGSIVHMPGTSSDMFVSDVAILNGCIQYDMNGNTVGLDHVQGNAAGAHTTGGCGSVRIGHETVNTVTTDPRISDSVFATDGAADYGVQVEDAGGLFFSNNDVLFAKIGMHIFPNLEGQAIEWAFFSNTVVGDTNQINALVIEPGLADSIIEGIQFNGSWAASAKDTNIIIQNTFPGATLDGIHFAGMRVFNSAHDALRVLGNVKHLTIDDSHFCFNGTGFTDVYIGDSISQGAIRNSEFGTCDNSTIVPTSYGVTFVNNNTGWIVTGNDFYGANVPINQAPISDSIVEHNRGVDTSIQTIPVAATLNLTNPTPYPNYQISGSGTITDIVGMGWFARKVLIYPEGNINFVAGETICNNYTATVGIPIELTNYGRCWIIK